ncbi:MAG: LysM peptidoglycan-binding domain-containing M23 family metallopeptidase [Alphaproteobacteria bacterium]|nr:LysM peptidoglycan-binding domain-containing M23 family metallopeptidase [Alphaproteobacteria bacterium]
MSLKISRAIRHLCEPKLIVSVTAALMLSACSNAMERFAENPSDADPVYTNSVPKQKIAEPEYSDEDAVTSRPLANAAPKPPTYSYNNSPKRPIYKQPTPVQQVRNVEPAPQVARVETPHASRGGSVTVEPGMTLYSIARANNMTVASLAAANNIRPPYSVRTGQVLHIPGASQAALPARGARSEARPVLASTATKGTAPSTDGVHEVRSGETLFSLGRKYSISPYAIAKANGLPNDTQLHLGQRVKIPGGAGDTAAVVAQAPKLTAPKKQPAEANPAPSTDEVAQVQEMPKPEPQQKLAELPSTESTATGMRWPVRGKVISNFGSKPNGLKNEGINIAVPEGTSIRAAEGGVVAYAGNELKGYGNLVLIRHEGGFVTAYAHAKELFVKRGDTVKRGDVIAKAGQTGSVSSPQLHFEVRKGATALDPIKYLSSATASN